MQNLQSKFYKYLYITNFIIHTNLQTQTSNTTKPRCQSVGNQNFKLKAKMEILNHVQPLSLSSACESFIVRYMHHVVWRQLDPPPGNCHSCFTPSELPMVSALPGRRGPVKDPAEFRRKMTSIRSYLGGNLVRSVQDNLVRSCQKFVSENRLKYGDILLYLIFQDQHSTFLSLTAKQVVYKKWKVREKMSLIRTLKQSLKLTKIQVPGIVNDSLLFVIAENCRLLEDLDVSTSYITDKGVLALAGVVIKDAPEQAAECQDMDVEEGAGEAPSGKRRRAATAAISRLEVIKDQKSLLRKLAYGRNDSKELVENISLLASKMKPYFSKRTKCPEAEDVTWSPSRGKMYSFNSERYGCPRLKRIDLSRTTYPKRTMDSRGDRVLTVGVTRDSVLGLLILMEQLVELRWQELGDILQLYEMLILELLTEEERAGAKLKLVSFMDISINVEKIKTAVRLCPDIIKLDLSLFNCSSYYQNITQDDSLLGHGIRRRDNMLADDAERTWVDILFDFINLKDLEAVYLDDSPAFRYNIR